MPFQPVSREQAKLRMALAGVSGGGKTLGALYIAYGITGDWEKIALIDTERERGRHYANRTDPNIPFPTGAFLYAPLYPPYSPDRYVQLVREGAEAVGPDGVVIIDSLSHGWSDEGGVLDIKEMLARTKSGVNDYTAWNDAGKEQKKLINGIFSVNCHTIATLRTKMEYTLQVNDRGKQQPVKMGLKPIQRDETEYEFDIVLNIARDHIATSAKDVTFLDALSETITPDIGKLLIDWLKQGAEPPRCEDCGIIIRGTDTRTAQEIQAASIKHAGRPMCIQCYGKWNKERVNTISATEGTRVDVPAPTAPAGTEPIKVSRQQAEPAAKSA